MDQMLHGDLHETLNIDAHQSAVMDLEQLSAYKNSGEMTETLKMTQNKGHRT